MFQFVLPIYTFVFSTTLLSRINTALLYFSLHARGYLNYRNFRESGEELFVKKYLARIKPKLCIDVGANIGNYTELLVRETNSQVLSFEPASSTCKQLKERFRNETSVIIRNQAIGEFNGVVTLAIKGNSAYNSRTLDPSSNSERVEMITLDSLLLSEISQIDFIKFDTEGFELECLMGAGRIIKEMHPALIQIEYGMPSLRRGIEISHLSKLLGKTYSLYQLTPKGVQKRQINDRLINIPFFSNFVYVCSKCLPDGVGKSNG